MGYLVLYKTLYRQHTLLTIRGRNKARLESIEPVPGKVTNIYRCQLLRMLLSIKETKQSI